MPIPRSHPGRLPSRTRRKDGTAWACVDCGEASMNKRYPSKDMIFCIDCQRWHNIQINARKSRYSGASVEAPVTQQEFLDWIRGQQQHCEYCSVPEELLHLLGAVNHLGRTVARLGIDRKDNTRGYELDNMALCCTTCNSSKNMVLSHKEMLKVGSSIHTIWRERLGEKQKVMTEKEMEVWTIWRGG